jgi:hypothetical protein
LPASRGEPVPAWLHGGAQNRRTPRRARALEDVLLPEVDETIAARELIPEDLERQDAVRARHAGRGGAGVRAPARRRKLRATYLRLLNAAVKPDKETGICTGW